MASATRSDEAASEAEREEEVIELPVQAVQGAGPARGGQNAEVYRIEPDGTVKQIWANRRERIHAMAVDRAGHLLLGTGEPARIYALEDQREHTLLTEMDELQVTVLVPTAKGEAFVGTSNSGRIYRLGTGFNATGTYLSDAIDASVTSRWGAVTWEADLPTGTKVTFYTRSGNSAQPDKTWSAWSKPLVRGTGEPIPSPPARFVQYKAELTSNNPGATPVLKEVTVSYLQKNLAPEVSEIRIHAPGDYYPESAKNVESESNLSNGAFAGNGNDAPPGRKVRREGGRSVSWQASDDNGDDLIFDLYYRGEDEPNWKVLVKDFRGKLYSWDSELVPDGRYFIKVVARDNPSNPPDRALASEKVSEPFKVDNTGPTVSDIEVEKRAGATVIRFTVQDALSNLKAVEYGLNADSWKLVYPVDGICDSKVERFEVRVSDWEAGLNTFVVRASDVIGNVGFGKTRIKH